MTGQTIDDLVDGLTPVRRIVPRNGLVLTLAMASGVTLVVAVLFGLRPDLLMLRPVDLVLLRAGTLLLLGFATMVAVVASARPAIGAQRDGWRWALGAALLFPASSIVLMMRGDPFPVEVLTAQSVRYCIGISLSGGFAIGAALTWWLRRGAVVDLRRAGWLVGLAAGAFGTFAYSLHCPSSSIHYIALWYSLAVASCALIGRLTVPRLLRW
jgi:hypothetical protein